MNSEIMAVLTLAVAIGLFLLWRIPIGKRIKKEEEDFIEQHIENYAILIFYGDSLEIGGWVFYNDGKQYQRTDKPIKLIERITSYYGEYTLSIPAGEYDSLASFDYNYGDGSKRGGTGYTKELSKKLILSQGVIYRYRLKDLSCVRKKQLFETIFNKDIDSSLSNHKWKYTVTFEKIKSWR